MADNFSLSTPGGTVTIAADEVSSGIYNQRVKVQHGADGSATDVSSASPMPVVMTLTGLTMHKAVSAATTNATSVVAGVRKLHTIYVSNANASARYFKLYDKAIAPTVGTDTPAHTLILPAGSACNISSYQGFGFSLGIAYALTTEATDAGTTAVSANEHVVNLGYTT